MMVLMLVLVLKTVRWVWHLELRLLLTYRRPTGVGVRRRLTLDWHRGIGRRIAVLHKCLLENAAALVGIRVHRVEGDSIRTLIGLINRGSEVLLHK
jgi:hypothetical protein